MRILLNGSIFDYESKIYKKIQRLFIISGIAFSTANTLTTLYELVPLYQSIVFSMMVGFVIIYIIFDIIIPVYINWLFIYKLKQISKFISHQKSIRKFKSRTLTSQLRDINHKTVQVTKTDHKQTKVCNDREQQKQEQQAVRTRLDSASDYDETLTSARNGAIAMNKTDESRINPIIINGEDRNEDKNEDKNDGNCSASANNKTNTKEDNYKDENENKSANGLVGVLKKCTLLALVIATSSILQLLAFITRFAVESIISTQDSSETSRDQTAVFQWIVISFDCSVNVVCLLFYFPFANNLIACLPGCSETS